MSYTKEFMDLLSSVKSKRPRTVIEHILKNGKITSQELKDIYGYNHPPRAIRDVRECGIPIKTSFVEIDGRRIGVYAFEEFCSKMLVVSKSSGRTALSKKIKNLLIEKYGSKCFIYLETMNASILQIDHRIPYEIKNDENTEDIDSFMLLCPSANRAKSWSCEHCENWKIKDVNCCSSCFWAYPEKYNHVAGREERMVNLVFTGNEIEDYNKLVLLSTKETMQKKIKMIIHTYVNKQ